MNVTGGTRRYLGDLPIGERLITLAITGGSGTVAKLLVNWSKSRSTGTDDAHVDLHDERHEQKRR